jgi:hypothetical protein
LIDATGGKNTSKDVTNNMSKFVEMIYNRYELLRLVSYSEVYYNADNAKKLVSYIEMIEQSKETI